MIVLMQEVKHFVYGLISLYVGWTNSFMLWTQCVSNMVIMTDFLDRFNEELKVTVDKIRDVCLVSW